MNPIELEQRLSRIATRWSVVREAHAADTKSGRPARGELLLQYRGAVYRYLLGGVRDPDVAEDLCQDFAVRFIRGDFRRANPERGRFRDYVKTALINLINDYHRQRNAGPLPLVDDLAGAPAHESAAPSAEGSFEQNWRHDVLDQTWKALAENNRVYHTVFLLRVENPDIQSPELAERAGSVLNKPMTADTARKNLQRAHAKFAELLVDQVAKSLDDPTDADIETELQALDLLKYCRSTLANRNAKAR